MNNRRKSQHGGSALEMALMLPWYMFLFVGTFSIGGITRTR
jgi:Flp pilus assembly protein TadG